MGRLHLAVALLGLLITSSSAAPAPAPGQAPAQALFLPQTTTAVAPVPSSSSGTAQAPVQRATPPTSTSAAPPTVPPTSSSSGLVLPPSVAPARAPATSTTPPSNAPAASPPTTPGLNPPGTTVPGAVSTPSRPAVAPAVPPSVPPTTPPTAPPTTSRPSSAPTSSQTTPTVTPAAASAPTLAPGTTPATPGNVAKLAPAPAVAPSSSGYYNVTLQANNATGALSQAQATQLQSQIQSYLQSQGGITTTARIASQSVGQSTSSAGRRLQQTTVQTFILDINIVLGPLSPSEAALCKQLLQGLVINLTIDVNITVIVTTVVIFIPVPVYVPVPATINNPPNVPALPPSASVTVPSGPSPPGTGSNIQSQNVAGGSTVTSQGIVNNVNSGNIINNNSGNSNVTNISNTNVETTNNIVNNIINNVQNPTTPGAQAPATPASQGSSTPGTTPAPATPATPGGASSSTADTTVTPPTYITQAAPPAAAPPAVPSPPPSPPPSCGSQPQCRIYTRDMLCCQNEGILSPYQGAQIEILCTHQVRFAITCLATSGPTNISAASVYNNDYGYNYNFRTNINWLGQTNGYLGKVTVDVEAARFAADRPECSLNLQTPCDLDGTLVSTMPAVTPLSFSVIDFNSFYQNYVGYPPTNAIGQFSYSWMNDTYAGGCLEQPTLTVPGSFFLGAWPSQPGFAYPCNATATYGALEQVCPNAGAQLTTGVTGIAPN